MRLPHHHSSRTSRTSRSARRRVAVLVALLVVTATAPVRAGELPTGSATPILPVGTVLEEPQATASAQAAGQALVGTFAITAGTCSGTVAGSYFQMIQPGGSTSGPFVSNSDSPCSNKAFTPMSPGTDGGLVTGSFQPQPTPPFDGSGNGRADRITKPQRFFGADFASATNPTDPQTGTKVSAPMITVDADGRLGGDLRAFAASWNGQHFNQGAPKPDGSTPGATALPTGTYNSATKTFVLDWTSLIVGGAFNNFTGRWHFEGTFSGTTTAAPPVSTPAGGGSDDPATVASGGGSASGPRTQRDDLADTGISVATGRALLLLTAGLAGLHLLRRQRRAGPATARG